MSSDRPPEFFFDRSLGWIAEGRRRGFVLLTKDQHIRYRAHELAALRGRLFCLASGNVRVDVMAGRLLAAGPAIRRVIDNGETGFWMVYEDGRIVQRWP